MTARRVTKPPPTPGHWQRETDVVVVGAGAAGISAALAAAQGGRRVLLLCKGRLGSGATTWAQGGLAAVLDPGDSVELHAQDTVLAGAGLCDHDVVRDLVTSAPAEVERLRTLGARFDTQPAHSPGPHPRLALTREGGHSYDRVVHAGGDASGAEVQRTLLAALHLSPVQVLESTAALDIARDESGIAVGLAAATVADDGRLTVGTISADAVVLATGGFGQAWATTTNPAGATGDGLALALRAGAEIRDVEFVQFHPTVLWRGPGARGQQLLISEAMRGEGAVLVDATGNRVMAGRHPLADLAPRDVVAAAIHERMASGTGGVETHVFLDAVRLGRPALERRFPTILAACRASGIDPVRDPIPVAPGAHYACGGVHADLSGRTTVPGLFAVGEVACTGVHGANRLASNSVTEALVAGRRAGRLLGAHLPRGGTPVWAPLGGTIAPQSRSATTLAMSRDAGVLRSADGLDRLLDLLVAVPALATPEHELTLEAVEATALHAVSMLVTLAARARRESRGAHRRSDAPGRLVDWEQHVTLRRRGDDIVVRTGNGAVAA